MTNQDWIINIENSAETIISKMGSTKIVDFIFAKYRATDAYELSPSDYQDVFNELYAVEVDLD